MKAEQARHIARQSRQIGRRIPETFQLNANPMLRVIFIDTDPQTIGASARHVGVVDVRDKEALIERGEGTHQIESVLRQLGYDVERRQEVQA